MAGSLGSWIWILALCGTWIVAWAQDAGDVVNNLASHNDECGAHDWQVVDIGSKCGSNDPCSYPKSWCSDEAGTLKCVSLPSACQKVLQGVTTAGTTPGGTTPPGTTPPASSGPKTTTTAAPATTSGPAQTEATTATTAPTTPAATAPPETAAPIIVPVTEPIRPLRAGPDGRLWVFFKMVGGLRPNCPDNSNFCCAWARNGECNDNAYFMQTYCRRSCRELRRGGPDAVGRPPTLRPDGLITIGGDQSIVGENAFGEPPGGTCQDLHPRCRLWASRGECKRNSLFMISMCRPACGKCPPCLPKCQTTCPGPYGGGGNFYGGGGGGGCQQTCTGCGR